MNGEQVRIEVQAAKDRLTDIKRQVRRVEDTLRESHLGLFVARERQLALQEAIGRLRSEMDEIEHGRG